MNNEALKKVDEAIIEICEVIKRNPRKSVEIAKALAELIKARADAETITVQQLKLEER